MIWLVPAILSIPFVIAITRPLPPQQGDYDFAAPIVALLRLLWLVPMLMIWLAFMAFMLVIR